MKTQKQVNPWWAALTAWVVVNTVNLLQAAGFLSRVYTSRRCCSPLQEWFAKPLAITADFHNWR